MTEPIAPVPGPAPKPTSEPTTEPTSEPTSEPTTEPTSEPTSEPTTEPTSGPTSEPTTGPTTGQTTGQTTEPVDDETVGPEPEAEADPAPDEPVVRPHRHRRRFGRGPLLAALLLAALGFSLVVQVRQTSVVGIASLNQSELVQILGTVTGQSQKVEQETQELLRTQAQLRSGTDRAAAAEKAAQERIQVLGILAGTVPAEGEGIELEITDGDNPVNASAILNAVQELRDAGAEAMQISSSGGSVRIVASTAFTDELGGLATGILVSRQLMRSPYTITAIGDRDTMSSALKIPGGVLDALDQSGARGEVRDLEVATVSAVVSQPRAGYASPGAG